MTEEELLKEVGGIVASEIHGFSSWVGKTKKYYVKTRVDPKRLNFSTLKSEINEISENHFEGSFWIISLIDEA